MIRFNQNDDCKYNCGGPVSATAVDYAVRGGPAKMSPVESVVVVVVIVVDVWSQCCRCWVKYRRNMVGDEPSVINNASFRRSGRELQALSRMVRGR